MNKNEKESARAVRRHERLKRIFGVLMRIVRPVAKRKFNLSYETLENIEGPYLVLSNHTTDWDCIFVGLASTRQLYFVATEKLARMGIGGRLVRNLFDPILHYKGKQGVNTIKAVYRHIRQGHNVAMFPEGNRSFNGETCPIPPATGKMARMCGGTLVTYRWTGGYFSSPRWASTTRKGKIEGHIAGVYTHEQLMAMTDEQLRETIERDLYVNAYDEQEREEIAYIGKNMTDGIESMLFMCPNCGRIGTLSSSGDNVRCSEETCRMTGWINWTGYFHYCVYPKSEKERTGDGHYVEKLTELDKRQRERIEEIYGKLSAGGDFENEEPVFSDMITRQTIDSSHKLREKANVRLAAFHDRLEIGDATVRFSDIEGLAINQRNLLLIHPDDCDYHYECDGPKSFSALKYLYICRAAKGSINGIL